MAAYNRIADHSSYTASRSISLVQQPMTIAKAELDSHADTCCLGENCLVIHDTEQLVSVEPFDKKLGSQQVKIITAAVAYDCPDTRNVFVLFFHQALHIPDLQKHLLCPNQLRHNQVLVNDTPLLYIPPDQRDNNHHSIIFQQPHPILHIPLSLNGTTSYFDTRIPTWEEVNNPDVCTHIHVTSEAPWDPLSPNFASDEACLRQSVASDDHVRGQLIQPSGPGPPRSIQSITSTRTSAAIDIDSYCLALASMSTTSKRKGTVTAEQLAKRWSIGLEAAKRTIQHTTQMAVRDFSSISKGRRLKPYTHRLDYRRLNVQVYCDTIIGKVTSLRGNKYATIFCTPFHWMSVEGMAKKSEAHYNLDNLFRRIGVPTAIIPDNAPELTHGDFRKKALMAQCAITPIEAYTPNANIAEHGVRELKRQYRKVMLATNSPECLWDCCMEHLANIRSHTALTIRELNGETPAKLMTGETPDISHLVEFSWYQYVWYLSPEGDNMERLNLGRYCGIDFDVGSYLCGRVLTAKGKFVHRSSIYPLSPEDERSDKVRERIRLYEQSLKEALKQKYEPYKPDPDDPTYLADEFPDHVPYQPIDDNDPRPLPELAEADDIETEAFDKLISARVCIPQGDKMAYGTVARRKRDADGNLIGTSHKNPIEDTSQYEIQFDTGEVETYTANQIAKHVYAIADTEGYSAFVMKDIIDHKKDDTAVPMSEATFTTKSGQTRNKKTTKGWKFCIQWNDGKCEWVKLKDLKESHPVEVAEYAKANQLLQEPAFRWWAPYALNTKNRILSAMKKRYFRRDQKYGIELPKTVLDAS